MARGRAVWTGHVRLSLVSLPVKLYSAVESTSKLSFRQIHEPTGKPVTYEKTVAGVGPIDAAEIVKGYEISKGEFVLVKPEEIDEIKLKSSRTIDLVQLVDAAEIDPLYFDRGYYGGARRRACRGGVSRCARCSRKTGKAGLGQLTMRGRECPRRAQDLRPRHGARDAAP